jgi:hypothetical protein
LGDETMAFAAAFDKWRITQNVVPPSAGRPMAETPIDTVR